MEIINIHEAKTHLSKLIDRVAQGEEIVIAKAGKPMARLSPCQKQQPRQAGSMAGEIWMADDFDASLPKDIENLFYDGE